MTAPDIIRALHAQGVTLALYGLGRIRVTPAAVLSPNWRQAIQAHREALLALLEAFEERAAIAEYCGSLSRAEAEKLAWQWVLGVVSGSNRFYRRKEVVSSAGNDQTQQWPPVDRSLAALSTEGVGNQERATAHHYGASSNPSTKKGPSMNISDSENTGPHQGFQDTNDRKEPAEQYAARQEELFPSDSTGAKPGVYPRLSQEEIYRTDFPEQNAAREARLAREREVVVRVLAAIIFNSTLILRQEEA
jgi:hypothetical protein